MPFQIPTYDGLQIFGVVTSMVHCPNPCLSSETRFLVSAELFHFLAVRVVEDF